MKTLLLLLTTITAAAQLSFGEVKHNQVNFFIDPVASYKEKGLLFGGEFEAVLNEVYLKLGYTNFMALEPIYMDAYVCFGANIKAGYFDDFKAFAGIKYGQIYRQSAPSLYPLFGIEGGLQQYLSEKFAIGCKMSYDWRTDQEFWSEEMNDVWILSGFIYVTVKLN